MAPNKESFDGNSENGANPSGKKPKSIENVVDELRNVLSGLQKKSSDENPTPADPPFVISEPEVIRPTFQEKKEPPQFEPLAPAAPMAEMPSDQDFWNGNVLGWPSDPPTLDNPAALENEPPLDNEPPRVFLPKEEAPAPQEPSLKADQNPPVQDVPVMDQMWIERKSDDKLPETFPKNETPPEPPLSPLEEIKLGDDFEFPPAPLSPEEAKSYSATEETLSGDLPAEPPRIVLPEALKVPIPGTLHQLPSNKNSLSSETKQEFHEETPKLNFHVACMFPEGQEEAVHQFIGKLETASGGIPEVHGVETVLMNTIEPANRNYVNWKKAASLAGANTLFIFAFKKDREHFKELTRVTHHDEIPCRLIFLEQISLRTLYGDVLADLIRRHHVKS